MALYDPRFFEYSAEDRLRPKPIGNSNERGWTQEKCDGLPPTSTGQGFHIATYLTSGSGNNWNYCYPDCPPSFVPSEQFPHQCEPRKMLTIVEMYYQRLSDINATCEDKIKAYDEAKLTDPNITPPTDCLQQIEDAKKVVEKAEELAKEVEALEPPFFDESGGVNQPKSRLVLTEEDIAKLPKDSLGVIGEEESSLAVKIRANPTYVDVHAEFLNTVAEKIGDLVWCCALTQEEYEAQPEPTKCKLFHNYNDYVYKNPLNIVMMRKYAPTITITRDAPITPVFTGEDPVTTRKTTCTAQGGEYTSDDCNGYCKFPPPADESNRPDRPQRPEGSADLMTVLLIAGGGIVLLYGGYKVFMAVSPTGRAMNYASSGTLPSFQGFKLVSA